MDKNIKRCYNLYYESFIMNDLEYLV